MCPGSWYRPIVCLCRGKFPLKVHFKSNWFLILGYILIISQVFIEILNENDNVPLTERPVYYETVPEGSPAGTNVFQLIADDDDIDTNQKIHFKIVSGDPEGHFSINSSTGEKIVRKNKKESTLKLKIQTYPIKIPIHFHGCAPILVVVQTKWAAIRIPQYCRWSRFIFMF